ncbi:hypothetical protein AltI4_10830 [Alteromonas sp. I4]|nr:hypothetical protein AltI4_10830 [Alteromonas sp. I4]
MAAIKKYKTMRCMVILTLSTIEEYTLINFAGTRELCQQSRVPAAERQGAAN